MNSFCYRGNYWAGLIVAGLMLDTAIAAPALPTEQLKGLIGSSLTAKPKALRRVLVFYRCEGFVHGKSIEVGNEAIRLAAAQSGAFLVDFSREYESLQASSLARYDAVVLNNTTGLETRKNVFVEPDLVAFVRGGKGLVVIHSGADNFYHAPIAAEMVGGLFWGHPWGGGGMRAFHLDDPASTVNAPFGGKDFKQGEEVYMQQSPYYTRAKLHVLVSLDLNDLATGAAKGQRRTDNDYAVSWIRPYGKGRVFYTSFGHDERAWLAKPTLFHILNGLQYALGDLRADDTPAGFSPAEIKAMKSAARDSEVFSAIVNVIPHLENPAVAARELGKAGEILGAADSTAMAKRGVLRAFQFLGAPAKLDAVTACLKDPLTREGAATLLAQTKTLAAEKALEAAWAGAEDEFKCVLLDALSVHGASEFIAKNGLTGKDIVTKAALAALGRIADEAALETLAKGFPSQKDTAEAALAACLGTMSDRNEFDKKAQGIARAVLANANANPVLRATAAKALVLDDAAFFDIAIADGAPFVRQAAVYAAAKVSTKQLLAALAKADARGQVALVSRLALNHAKDALPEITKLVASTDDDVAAEALRAIAVLGGRGELPVVVAALERPGVIGNAAAAALEDLRGEDVSNELFAEAQKNNRLIAVLGDRADMKALGLWKPLLKSESTATRRDAWKALGRLANAETLGRYLGWISLVKKPESFAAGSAIKLAAKSVSDEARAKLVTAAWAKADAVGKGLLADLMATYPSADFLKLLCGDVQTGATEEMLVALGNWDSMAAYEPLVNAYRAGKDEGLKSEAIRDAAKLASKCAGKDYAAKMTELFRLSDEKNRPYLAKSLFSACGLESFDALEGLFGDAACGQAAKRAYVSLYQNQVKALAAEGSKPITEKKNWKVSASKNGHSAKKAIDGDAKSRWETGTPSDKGMWFTLNLGERVYVSEVTLHTEDSATDTPNGCEVFLSNDGKSWSGPVARSDGKEKGKTVFAMSAMTRQMKFVTTGGRPGLFWSIHEIEVKSGLDSKKVEAIAAEAGKLGSTK